MQDNQKVISDYSNLTEAAMSGNTDTINSALAEIQSGIDTTLEIGSEAAIEQANTAVDRLKVYILLRQLELRTYPSRPKMD